MIHLTDQPLEPGELLTRFSAGRTETGAIASFAGLARAEWGQARALILEAYPGFTEAAIAEFATAASTRFGLDDYGIWHRTGEIAPGETIVFVVTAATHRRAAFEACDLLMDYLKSRAPFWKKELGPEGSRWIEPRPQDHIDLARWEKT